MPLQPFQHADREQRVATQLKEVIVAPNPIDAQQLGPDLANDFLDLALRRFKAASCKGIILGREQRLAIDLAVRRERQCIEAHESRWHHVFGQTRAEVTAQRSREFTGVKPRVVVLRSHIRDQPRVATVILTHQHH